MKKFARKCSISGAGMNEGWCFGDGEEYASTEGIAHLIAQSCGYESIQEAYDDGACYWTEWEDEDDYQYAEIDGKLTELFTH